MLPLRPTTTRVVLKVVMPLISVSVDGPSFWRSGKHRLLVRCLPRVIVVEVLPCVMADRAPTARALLSWRFHSRVLHRCLGGNANLHYCPWLHLLQVLDFRPQLCVFCVFFQKRRVSLLKRSLELRDSRPSSK